MTLYPAAMVAIAAFLSVGSFMIQQSKSLLGTPFRQLAIALVWILLLLLFNPGCRPGDCGTILPALLGAAFGLGPATVLAADADLDSKLAWCGSGILAATVLSAYGFAHFLQGTA